MSIKYRIVEGCNTKELEEKVNGMLDAGYKLLGPPFFQTNPNLGVIKNIYQTMVFPNEE